MHDLTKYMPLDAIVQNYEEAKKEIERGTLTINFAVLIARSVITIKRGRR